MWYLWRLFFNSSLIFIITNHIILYNPISLLFLEYSEEVLDNNSSASRWCLALAWFLANFDLALLIERKKKNRETWYLKYRSNHVYVNRRIERRISIQRM